MAASLLLGWAPPKAVAQSGCDDGTRQRKTDDDSVLIVPSGPVFQELPGDEIDSSLGPSVEDMVIRPTTVALTGKTYMIYEIFNTDENEKVLEARPR